MNSNSQQQLPATALLTIMAMVSPVALNILLPALPDISRALESDTATIQLSFTLYLLSLAIGQLLCGPLADRYGRRPVLLAGFALHLLGCLMGAFAVEEGQLLFARVLQALGGCTGMVLARTIMLDLYTRDQAAGKISYITLAIAISQAIAPFIGGHLNLMFGWSSIFYFSLILGSVSWLIVLFKIPETVKHKSESLAVGPIIKQYAKLISSDDYLSFALSTTFIAAAFYLFIGSAPYLVDTQLGGDSADYGAWFLWVSFGFMAGSFISAKISPTLGTWRMIYLGHGLSLLGALIMLFAVLSYGLSYLSLFVPMSLFTFGRGMSQPNAQTSAISFAHTRAGTASGLLGFIQLLFGALVAQLTPLLLDNYLLIVIAILITPLLALITIYRQQLKSPPL